MSKMRIDEVTTSTIQTLDNETARLQRRKELHKGSSFERSGPETFAGIGRTDLSAIKAGSSESPATVEAKSIIHTLPDGTEIEIPQLSADDRAKAEAILVRLSPDGQSQLIASAEDLGAAVWNEVLQNPEGVNVGSSSAGLSNAANNSYEVYTATTGENNRNNVTEGLLVTGMAGVEQNLFGFFDQLQGKQTLGNGMRADIAELTGMLADWPAGAQTQVFSYSEVVLNADGTTKVIEHKNEVLTKEQAQALLEKLQGQQDALSTITSMDSNKLQLMTERYQQAMSVLSNIIKSQDETRKGIIANAKAS